jgi:subtilisin family serine protease
VNVRWLIIPLLLALLGCAAPEGRFPILADDAQGAGRRILVTFVDRSINRSVPGNPLDGYRVRGVYDNSDWSKRVSTELAEHYGLRLLAQWPVTTLGVACVVYEIPEGQSLEQVLQSVGRSKQVGSVQAMRDYRVLNEPALASSHYNDPYLQLQRGFQALRIEQAHGRATGRGVRIAVIDTGVDNSHPDLRGRIKESENLAPAPANQDLADIHGTAVAGVLAAQPGNGIGIAGVAPGADIFSMRACWPEAPGAAAARCNSYTLALALNEAIRLRSDIINMSLTGPDDPLVQLLVEEALRQNIIVVAAVPQDPEHGGFPANVPGVLPVASGEGHGQNSLVGPSVDVLTTIPHGSYDFMSGSSFAAPHVAGVIALLLELHPHLSAADIRLMLKGGKGGAPLDAVATLSALH